MVSLLFSVLSQRSGLACWFNLKIWFFFIQNCTRTFIVLMIVYTVVLTPGGWPGGPGSPGCPGMPGSPSYPGAPLAPYNQGMKKKKFTFTSGHFCGYYCETCFCCFLQVFLWVPDLPWILGHLVVPVNDISARNINTTKLCCHVFYELLRYDSWSFLNGQINMLESKKLICLEKISLLWALLPSGVPEN